MANNTLEIIRHIPSGCLYAAVGAHGTRHIIAVSDELTQAEADAINADNLDSLPEWASEGQLEWAQHESFADVRVVSTQWGL